MQDLIIHLPFRSNPGRLFALWSNGTRELLLLICIRCCAEYVAVFQSALDILLRSMFDAKKPDTPEPTGIAPCEGQPPLKLHAVYHNTG